MPRFLFSILTLGSAICASADDLHYTILFNGAKAGSASYNGKPSGQSSAQCELNLGGTVLKETLVAQFSKNTLVSSALDSEVAGGKMHMVLSDGKLVVTRNGSSKTLPYAPKRVFYGANLLAPYWSSSAGEARRLLLKSPNENSVTVSTYLIDAGAEVPVTYRRMPSRKAVVGGKTRVAEALQMNLASVQAELDLDSSGTVVAFDVPGQKLRFVLDGWTDMFDDPMAKFPELSQPIHKTVVDKAVTMKTRDGVELVSTVFRPVEPGKYPVILARTPYGRQLQATDAEFYAQRGFVFVSQDVRGRGDSQGDWDPFVYEGEDGYDAIQWVADQPWSSGKVGMIGGSYGGYVQWAAAVKRPAALKCIVPQVTPPDAMHNLPYEYGVPFIYADLWWANIVAGKSMNLASLHGALPHPEKMTSLPLEGLDESVLGQKIPFYRKWLSRSTIGDWKGFDFFQHLSDADVPALQISGWFDGDGIGTKLIWAEERKLGHHDQWLIEGPWQHAFNTTSSLGKVDYGTGALIDLNSVYLRWFDTWLKGKDVSLANLPKVRVFVTGANRWLDLKDWPDPSETSLTLYLGTNGNKHSLAARVGASGEDPYTYDPAKDTDISLIKQPEEESFTGLVDLSGKTTPYLLYTSEPLKRTTAIAGPAVVHLNFVSDAKDTDFAAIVVDVDEKGKVHVFGQAGKMRASYLGGVEKRVPLEPGRAYKADVQPWEFAHEIKLGHRIGLLITSSLFPMYARNLGTDEPIATGTKMVAQHNRILFGRAHPSSVQLQVLYER